MQLRRVSPGSALLWLGVAFHVVFVFVIFDVYFTSPVVRGVPEVAAPTGAPAHRVVLFVGTARHTCEPCLARR